ncbi:MAG TPA: hypothetical protein VM261_16710 [Kofleriaceae bacterium]|nr:hypothetical protein [Kofleriaceae bacterium]
MCSAALSACTMCNDDRPAVDHSVGSAGKTLGKANEQAAETPLAAADELKVARQRFIASSQVQLGALAAEIEARSRNTQTPIDRIETLRKDFRTLTDLRQKVLDAGDEGYADALNLYESQVDTIREQFSRIDRGQLP